MERVLPSRRSMGHSLHLFEMELGSQTIGHTRPFLFGEGLVHPSKQRCLVGLHLFALELGNLKQRARHGSNRREDGS